ncbi:MAG: UTP--glucose-1-phosphate uridylyltransferase [Ktedonobacteraceae bacterium]
MKVRKAVIPVAGLGTRMLPATKVVPKELLPVVNKTVLEWIVEEAVAAGIKDIIFVTSRFKGDIADQFSGFPELEAMLKLNGQQRDIEELRHFQSLANYFYVRQPEPLGLGHAILCAKKQVGDEPFAIMLGDNITPSETPCLPRMIEVYEKYGGSVLSLVPLPPEMVPTWGIARVKELESDIVNIVNLVEKPKLEEAPSNLGIYGRYILTPDIFAILEKASPTHGGEIQITDSIEVQVQAGRCYGIRFNGEWYDTGSPLGLLKTSIALALKQPDIAPALRESMRQMLKAEQG